MLLVTHGVLDAVGVKPLLGRWFSRADDTPGSAETVILAYGYWQRRFGGDRSILGRTVTIESRVAPEVVAELRPCRRQTPVPDRLEELLDALAAAGEITRAAQPKGDWTWRSRGLGLPLGTAQALLDELRQERA